MKADFQSLHISTEVLKPQQVTIAMKAVMSSSDDEVEFTKMSIDEEILQLESYLPTIPTAPLQKISSQVSSLDKPFADNSPKKHTTVVEPLQETSSQIPSEDEHSNRKLALATVKTDTKKLDKKPPKAVWDMLTFMDTGGQPQFISMLPAVNSFAMITFIIHKLETGGQSALNKIVQVQYGNENGEISYEPHPHKYTYLQLIETLISYASNILLPDTAFLDRVKKVEAKASENTRSIVLAGTHSGDDQLSEHDIQNVDKELTKVIQKSGINYIKPRLNK